MNKIINKPSKVRTTSHPLGKCGNVGCISCNGIKFSGFLVNNKPVGMPNWLWKKWKVQND